MSASHFLSTHKPHVAAAVLAAGVFSFAFSGCAAKVEKGRKSGDKAGVTIQSTSTVAAGKLLDRNLIVNGDAEGNPSAEVNENKLVGWSINELLSFSTYGGTAGEWDVDAKPYADVGEHYFRLAIAEGKKEAKVTQRIYVNADMEDIDSGNVTFELSGYFGTTENGEASSRLAAHFIDDVEEKELGMAVTEPVTLKELPRPLKGSASMMRRQVTGTVPVGTRSIDVELIAYSLGEPANTTQLTFADNLSLVLHKK